MKTNPAGPVLYCGDPHGQFRHIIDAAGHTKASAVVLLGDMEPAQPLHLELAPLLKREVPIWFIPGNHDADSDQLWERVWESEIADRNIHGRVIELPNGQRLAGLGGVFRGSVWYPKPIPGAPEGSQQPEPPRFESRDQFAKSTPRQDRWRGSVHRKHWGTIYPDEFNTLSRLRADVLVIHEAPGYHRNGFEELDALARAIAARVVVHGHQHDNLDSSARWQSQGFRSYGVGLRGITAIDADGVAEIIVPGELDEARSHRQLHLNGTDGDPP